MYISTRGGSEPVTASRAICLGIAPDGGLYVPQEIARFDASRISSMAKLTYPELAETILACFLDDYSAGEIHEAVRAAYGGNFAHPRIAPLILLDGFCGVLELFHGPTAAFKDMALQLTPRLLTQALAKEALGKKLLILVATSGDTGKAALEGFKDVPGISVACFFPDQGVSKAQELQMRSTDGANTFVYGVKGNFDDCQNGVKAIFNDAAFNKELAEAGWQLSSANSINWGRLCPQIVYYFYGYFELVRSGQLEMGQNVNFVVPTGNFGNILSAWYAREMGLPVGKLICASNDNRVLTDFFESGLYDSKREFYATSSPSMDILISSNLERFLFEMNGHDARLIKEYMESLSQKGAFRADDALVQRINAVLAGGSATGREAAGEIRRIFEKYHYLMDTHTAVGAAVYRKYREATGDKALAILDATASPFKFSKSVLEALDGDEPGNGARDKRDEIDELRVIEALAGRTGASVHQALLGLEGRPILHPGVISRDEMKTTVKAICV